MIRAKSNLIARSFAVVLLVPGITVGDEIFHWVDEDGVVNFSDWAPEVGGVEVTKLKVGKSNPPDYDPTEDQNSILDQAERMKARWEELKERQEDRRREREEPAESQRVPQYAEYHYPYYRPGFFFRPVVSPAFVHPRPLRAQKRQLSALDQLGLLAKPRPHSINSSAHLSRINAGRSLQGGVHPQVSHFQER